MDSTRVGRITNYDKLTIELKTDGTIKPSEALKQASKILQDLFMIIYQPPASTKKTKHEETVALTSEVLNTSLEELDLPVRLTNSLKAGKVETRKDTLTPPVSILKRPS